MRKILRLTAPVAAAAALLAACGADTTQSSSKRPAVIRVGASAGATPAAANGAAGEMAADSKMAVWRPTNYVLGEGLTAPTGPRRAWSFPAAGTVATDAQKAALAKAFGLTGSWSTLPKDQGGYSVLGDVNNGKPGVSIQSDSLGSWWYSPGWSTSTGVGCIEPAVAADAQAATSGASEGSTGTVAVGTDGSVSATPTEIAESTPTVAPDETAVVDCTPKTPANVPTKAEAEEKAKSLFEQIGIDTARYSFEAYADEWGAYVTGWLVLDDMKTQLAIGVGFGAEGAITSANGFLGEPVPGDEYDLVTLEDAVKRMNDPNGGYWGGYYGGVMPMARGGVAIDAVAAAPAPEASTVGGSATGTGSDSIDAVGAGDPGLEPEPVPAESVPGGPVAIDPMPPVTEMPMDPITVTLTGVTMGLSQLWDADGNVWLLPAYIFTTADGGQYPVFAIGDEFLDFSGINGTADTLPTDTVPADGVETTAVAVPATDLPTGVDPAEPTTTVYRG